MSSAEMPHTETVSPLPSSMDLLIQDSPDSSTSPKGKQPTSAEKSATKKEDKVPVKKQKTRTVFSSTQLCVLNDRFQRQKYLSLQQMQELSNILNLSYKQVKTWFQNQRMKSKRWQKNNWLKNSNGVTQVTGNFILFFPFSDLSILSIPETHNSSHRQFWLSLYPFC
uniref:Homeobox domain-containing protein n=1 Tax=Gorilla gorilla gorilla TaxID=9595 RepID=G3RDK5_GORGO